MSADMKFVTTATTSGRVKKFPAVQIFPQNKAISCKICKKYEILILYFAKLHTYTQKLNLHIHFNFSKKKDRTDLY